MAEVLLKNVHKVYAGCVNAVIDLNLRIKNKEFTCLLGPSGCGKTSTLRMIAGLEKITSGDIFIDDLRINDLEPKDRDIAMVFESYALYPHMSVAENMGFPLKVRKTSPNVIKQKVEHAATILQMQNLLERKPKELSGGQKQRVAIGRAIVREPKVFLYDEPISHLDAKLRAHMRAELKRLQKELQTTTIYVTHDQLEAMTMADSIAVMNLGVLQQFGDGNEVYRKPANSFVAGFVGEPAINFINCQLNIGSDKSSIECESFKYDLSAKYHELLGDAKDGKKVKLGVRPLDIIVSKDRPEGQAIEAELYVNEPLGHDVILHLRLDGDIIKAKTTSDFQGNMGDRLWVQFDDNQIYLFDEDTGHTLL